MKIEDLRSKADEELMQLHDELLNRAPDYNIYLAELARRDAVRQGERMEELTRSINWLTWVVMGATVIGVIGRR
jgi:hypothetical protein